MDYIIVDFDLRNGDFGVVETISGVSATIWERILELAENYGTELEDSIKDSQNIKISSDEYVIQAFRI